MQAIPGPLVLPENTIGLQETRVIPFEISSRLVPRGQTCTIVELGKNLLRAARQGNADQVRDLMSKGAPFTTDWLGTSPLHYAALNNHLETCEILLRAGICRDARTKVDRTPLHMAAYAGHLRIVEILLANGAEVDSLDMLRMTPLHWAVQNAHPEVVTFLLRNGANPNAINKFDKTPCNIAADIRRLDILQILQVVTKDPEPLTEESTPNIVASNTSKTDFFADVEEVDMEPCKEPEELADDEDDDDVIAVSDDQEDSNPADLPDSMQILKEHGISFIPADTTTSVVASAVENGHSLVLTEVGKQVLNSTKHLAKVPIQRSTINKIKPQKLIAVTPEQLLAMTHSQKGIFRKVNVNTLTSKPIRRLVMNKNRYTVSGVPHILKRQPDQATAASIEYLKKQLAEARRQAEEYRTKSEQKIAEAEKYEKQLKSMTQGK